LNGVLDLATGTKPLTTKNVDVFFYLMTTDFRRKKTIAFRKVPRLSPFALLVRQCVNDEYGEWWDDNDRGKQKY
jgi:hypothetical protein